MILAGTTVLSSQTILDAQPRRVTTGTVVTVTGTGFYEGLETTLTYNPGGFNITASGNREYVNSTTMTFTIEQTQSNDVLGSELRCADCTNDNTGIFMDYIGPVTKNHRVNGSNQVTPRVEEIYTDFSESLSFKDGDVFDISDDYDATQFGRWEFYGLTFPATPQGVLVEAGGQGRGMFIGFNDAGDFVARGGDGRPGAAGAPHPAGCARVVINPSEFANKSGNLIVTMNPQNGELTLTFDAFGDGVIDVSVTDTATLGRMGYDGFTEWSGGNAGDVGTSSGGNVAGAEITGNYDFNGTMDGLIFSNTSGSSIAWRSSQGTYDNQPSGQVPSNPILPDNNHDLLGFKMGGIIYSTGANDALLEKFLGEEVDNLDGGGNAVLEYVPGTFKAYSTNGVQNTTVSQHHIFTGDLLDGKYEETAFEFLSSSEPKMARVRGLSMFEVLYDGRNGLNIGTGINNLNQSTTIQFFSGNGQFGAVNDGVPDLLIPNMAEAGGTDVYYFSDEIGNVIGRPVKLTINNSDTDNPPLSHWINDQYRVDLGESFELAKPSERIYGQVQERPMRLIALELDDFGITGEATLTEANRFTNIQSMFNINAGAGGTADVPFLAYNGDTFEIKSPIVTQRPTPRSICEADGTATAVFEVDASVDGGFSGPGGTPTLDEELEYQWFKFNEPISGATSNVLTVNNITTSDLGLYRLRIKNTFGTSIVSVDIQEGGTRVTWNGTKWVYPPGFKAPSDPTAGLQPIADADRKMVITGDWDILAGETPEGCSCDVFPGNNIFVRSNATLKVYDEVNLRQADTIFGPGGVIDDIIPAGKLILEDDASLVQTKDVSFNQNFGEIIKYRNSENIKARDYVFWSSPVEGYDISGVSGDLRYEWRTAFPNANGTSGNWFSASGIMQEAQGYIVREPLAGASFTTTFTGRPNNGRILKSVDKSIPTATNPVNDRHWNFVGNPYPSAISAEKFLNDPANALLTGFVNLWTRAFAISTAPNPGDSPFYDDFKYNYPDSYVTYNLTGSSTPEGFDGNIASGQGFFIQVRDDHNLADGSEILFSNTMRTANNGSALDNGQFYRGASTSSAASEDAIVGVRKELVWLSIVDENLSSGTTLIGYVEGATDEKDRLYDAVVSDDNPLSIYSLIEDTNYIIQGRSYPFNDADMVQLGVQIPSAGIYSIVVDDVKGTEFTSEGRAFYIEDTYTGIVHDLTQSPFSFTADVTGTINDRFVLRYTANQLSVEEKEMMDDLKIYYASQRDKIVIMNPNGFQIESVEVFNMLGQSVQQSAIDRQQNYYELPFNNSQAGAYVLHVRTDRGIQTKKFIVSGLRD
jgi:hypothetical protein